MKIDAIESAILGQLEKLLPDSSLGYRLVPDPDHEADLLVEFLVDGTNRIPVMVEVCQNPRRAPIRHAAERVKQSAKPLGAIPVIGLPRIGPGLRQFLRDLDVGFISLDGQVYIKGPGLLIDRQVPTSVAKVPWGHEPSLFADKSSLLLRYLFNRPSVPLRIVDLAGELGISPGLASRIATRLKNDGYLVEDNGVPRVTDRAALLDDWRDFYRRRAKRQQEHRFYLHARDSAAVMDRLRKANRDQLIPTWGLSFHAGASLVAPYSFFSEVHVLVDVLTDYDAPSVIARSLGLEPADREANVIIVEPYYRHSWSYGLREIEGLPVVSDIQLFLDLCTYPRRGPEQASRIRDRILATDPGAAT